MAPGGRSRERREIARLREQVAWGPLAASVLIGIMGIIAASLLPALGQATSAGWSTLAPLPTARQEISVSVLDGKVFVIAGYDANGQSTATVEVYDPRSNAWQKAAPLPIATNHNAAATVNGRLYAFGGTSPRTFVYAADRDAWTEVASMRYTHGGTPAVAVIGGKIYVAGGTGADMVGNELEVYDPAADKWQVLAAMGVPRNHTAGGSIRGRFYVVGGRGSPSASTAHEMYDPTTNTWTTRAALPTGRSGIAAGVVGERLYVFGGEIPRLFGEVEVYDPATDRWQSLAPMPEPRHGIFAGVIGNTIYLPGGGTRQGLGATNVNSAFRVSP
jgi:N-acetylneuraminic acid mutarotase